MGEEETPETCVVMITCGTEDEARRIGRQLVDERLVACASVQASVDSIYRWKGKVEEDVETGLILKTCRSHVERVVERVKELHSYELPEVVALPIVAGLGPYIQWIREMTAAHDG
ncbi:MAG: divalent-cation tolerance protein CutA [Planctomycetota bacterium]